MPLYSFGMPSQILPPLFPASPSAASPLSGPSGIVHHATSAPTSPIRPIIASDSPPPQQKCGRGALSVPTAPPWRAFVVLVVGFLMVAVLTTTLLASPLAFIDDERQGDESLTSPENRQLPRPMEVAEADPVAATALMAAAAEIQRASAGRSVPERGIPAASKKKTQTPRLLAPPPRIVTTNSEAGMVPTRTRQVNATQKPTSTGNVDGGLPHTSATETETSTPMTTAPPAAIAAALSYSTITDHSTGINNATSISTPTTTTRRARKKWAVEEKKTRRDEVQQIAAEGLDLWRRLQALASEEDRTPRHPFGTSKGVYRVSLKR